MNGLDISFSGETLTARGSGALYWPSQELLCVSDLHLGRTERIARQGGQIIPPFENADTLTRLETEIAELNPKTVACLGDSFDDIAASLALTETENEWIRRLQAGREWIWIEGNHDPAPLSLGGTHLKQLALDPLVFRHIAETGATGEISGHYHPKFTVRTRHRSISRAAFLFDDVRLILPAFGTYTGGLNINKAPMRALFGDGAKVVLTGDKPRLLPAYSAAKRSNNPASSRTD